MSGEGSNEGVMRNVDALFGIGVGHATSSSSSPSPAAMRVAAYSAADGMPVYRSITPPSGSSPKNGVPEHQQYQQHPSMVAMTMKKKRGRPRKYSGVVVEGTDGNMPLALMPPAPPPSSPPAAQPTIAAAAAPPQSSTGGGEFSSVSGGGEGGPLFKKARGRPPGSTNKVKKNHQQHHIQQQPLSLGSAGVGFTPHVISVKAGEDVSSKIMSFSQNGPRAVCILSANGSISNVTLRQAATSGGTATYEGRFEILSLCGSFLLMEVAGHRSRTGGLSVSLAGSDGRVLGGCVAGLLTAASPVQVIVGSFIPGGRKESKTLNHTEPTHISSLPMPMPMSMSMSMPPMLFSGSGGAGGGFAAPAASGSPPSHEGDSFSESSGEEEEGSPPNHSTGGTTATNNHHHINNNTNNPHAMLGMPWR